MYLVLATNLKNKKKGKVGSGYCIRSIPVKSKLIFRRTFYLFACIKLDLICDLKN